MSKRASDDYWDERESPNTITGPEEFRGGASLAIFCTQTGLGAAAQRRLVDEWCSVLPTLNSVTHIWFHSRVPQRLFEAACRVPSLIGIWIKWSGIEDLEPLSSMKGLSALYLGSSTKITSIDPLVRMTGLKHLNLENLKLIKDLSPLSRLSALRQLSAIGAFPDAAWEVDSLEPIGQLTCLEYFNMGMLRPKSLSLRPLAGLKKLRFLGLDNRLPMSEYAWLSRRLPSTECMRFKPYVPVGKDWGIQCRKCKSSKDVVLVTGKGGPHLCKKCDAPKLAKYVAAYEEASNAL